MSGLIQYDTMRCEVQTAATIDEAATIRDQAEALRAYAKQRHDPELEMWMGEIKVRAAARIGELLRELDKARPASTPGRKDGVVLPIGGKDKATALKEAGISTSAAQRYEEAAAVPPTVAERYYRESKAAGKPPTVQGLRAVQKKENRAEKEIALGQQQAAALLADKRYGVIMADPPWSFAPYSRDTGMDRAADNHYPTMSLEDNWFRNKHELLLVGTRGNIPAPAPGTQFASVIEAAVGAHSAKPMAFAEMIEEMFPTLPALEIFARGPRAGWTVWGNEAAPQEVRGQAVA